MKIEVVSLRAVNCGPLRDVVIDFTNGQGNARPVTLLAGANGSGKTTVLELIVNLAETIRPSFVVSSSPLNSSGYAQLDTRIDGQSFCLFFGTRPADTDWGADFFGFETKLLSSGGEDTERRRGSSSTPDLWLALYELVSNAEQAARSPKEQIVPSMPCFLYFPFQRYLSTFRGEQLSREYTPYQWVYSYKPAESYRGSLDSYLIWLEYAEPELYASVQHFLNEIYSNTKQFGVERRTLQGVVTTPKGEKHGLGQLSSGEQNLLILLLEIRRRVTPGSVVLIDELENSLHPAFQHRLAQGLLQLQRETPFQLIVTSHADEIYKVFGAESTVVLPMPRYA